MSSFLCLSCTFLDPRFHGRGADREPQWPPSPLRAFQAWTAAAAAHWNERKQLNHAAPALRWLEKQPAPIIVAPSKTSATPGHLLSVPNNSMDITARAWSRGNLDPTGEADPRKHRTMKAVRPMHMIGGDTIHFLWSLAESLSADESAHIETLQTAAHSIVALGWGVDLVAASARIISTAEFTALPGERWLPSSAPTSTQLQLPKRGTLDALRERHTAFLARVRENLLTPPAPLSSVHFDMANYRRIGDPLPQPCAAFQLLQLGDPARFHAYDPVRHTHLVAAMMRAAVAKRAAADGWDAPLVRSFVQGHGPNDGEPARGVTRFAYLPMPSLEVRSHSPGVRHVGAIRRVMVAVLPEPIRERTDWAAQKLSGEILTPLEHETRIVGAILQPLSAADRMIHHFTAATDTWASVTPVLLPGTGRRNPTDMRQLIRRAILNAGLSDELATCAEIQWQPSGFFSGVELATRYARPRHLASYCTTHVRIRWRNRHGSPILLSGPICLGVGRFYGLGLLAHIA